MKLLLFTKHQRDCLSWIISALTRGHYVHAALLTSASGNWIIELFYPKARKRQLQDSELAGIDVFSIAGMTPAQEAGVLAYAQTALALGVRYSIMNLFRFLAPVRWIFGEGQREGMTDPKFCSEFAFLAIREGGGIALLRAHAEDVDPERLSQSPLLVQQPPLAPTH